MTRLAGASFMLACVVLLGCAGPGKNFVRPAPETFALGTTTYSEVAQHMGEPQKSGLKTHRGAELKAISYFFIGEDYPDGHHRIREQNYFFHDGVLVGESFSSTFEGDSTNFDEAAAQSFVKGKTTRDDVIRKLGRPHAAFIAPVVAEDAAEELLYQYYASRVSVTGLNLRMRVLKFSKVLALGFDGEGRLRYLSYKAQGEY